MIRGREAQGLLPDSTWCKLDPRPQESLELVLEGGAFRLLQGWTGGSASSTFAVFLAALQACLYAYDRIPTVVTGVPARRDGNGATPAPRALPVSVDVDPRSSFRAFTARVTSSLEATYAHRSPSTSAPLYRVAASFAGLHGPFLSLGCPLHFALRLQRDRLSVAVEYDPGTYLRESVERFGGHLITALASALEHPDRPLAELRLSSGEEQRRLLVDWNRTERAFPRDVALAQIFEAQVARTPNAPALRFEGVEWTYAELNTRANRLAHHLRSLGAKPEELVGISIRPSLERVVGLLGISKSGAAFMPFDASYPRERMSFMLEDSGVSLLLTESSLAQKLPSHGRHVLCIDSDWDLIARSRADDPTPVSALDDLVYVMYTSGSTGRPKGVALHQRPLVNLIHWHLEHLPAARTLQFAALSFDVSFHEVFSTCCAGGTLIVAPEAVRRDVRGLVRFLAEEAVEKLTLPVPLLQEIAASFGPEAARLQDLRHVIATGEQLRVTPAMVELFRVLERCTLHNHYGPSETHLVTTYTLPRPPADWPPYPPIGRPIANTRAYVLGDSRELLPEGAVGELHFGGVCPARGYVNRPELTAERFVPDPFTDEPGARMYRTGDLARYLPGGALEFLGRVDQQVKIRGVRVEPREIELALCEHPSVRDAVILAREDRPGDRRLVAYVVAEGGATPSPRELRDFLAEKLPSSMLPSPFVFLDALPLSPNGKLDRNALPPPAEAREQGSRSVEQARGDTERRVLSIWERVLGFQGAGIEENFFDLGGNSLLLARVQKLLGREFDRDVLTVELYRHPSVRALARYLDRGAVEPSAPRGSNLRAGARRTRIAAGDVAVIGMAGRFPGARNVHELWLAVRGGIESIVRLSREELLAAGENPAVIDSPGYVPAAAIVEGAELFDAAFFGDSPREAELMDPQHRLFLECSWEALERAGYAPGTIRGWTAVFAGAMKSSYLLHNILTNPELVEAVGDTAIELGNDADYLATRVSYKLDLRGPSLTVQTACSTSLVGIHLACKSLLAGECDMALAGGVTLTVPQRRGYRHREGGIFSPDGHCRAFDADARGTVCGDGVAIVVLKRLEDALADGDTVCAVIKGSAINNDGSLKVGYTAPSVDGQVAVIREALALAGVEPESIGYVEAHGTGTERGDPIEVEALTRAFREHTEKKGFCALGSVKANVGHLVSAAGATGLIKAVLALQHAEIPPLVHFQEPNPDIDFEASPFRIPRSLEEWKQSDHPRRAGVSSFGFGGTNAHVVLEEAPPPTASPSRRSHALLLLSARTRTALETSAANLAAHLRQHPEHDLFDVAFTLQVGRAAFRHRAFLVAEDRTQAAAALESAEHPGLVSAECVAGDRPIVFLLPGQGAQYAGMARELYETEPSFRTEVDHCCETLAPHLGVDLRRSWFAAETGSESPQDPLLPTSLAQPALFTLEYALARLLTSWGLRPAALLGHSIGEFVAACLAGVFSLEDALRIVAVRATAMQALPQGSMLAVPLPAAELEARLQDDVEIAAENGPALCVVSGPSAAVDRARRELEANGVVCRRLHTSHAFHSAAMEAAIEPVTRVAEQIELRTPRIPFLSNVTGTWIEDAQATDPGYWGTHLRRPVRFSACVSELLREPENLYLEVGPGRTLCTLLRLHGEAGRRATARASLPGPAENDSDHAALWNALGRLWLAGAAVDWRAIHAEERRRRVPLPTYPFERKRYWIEPGSLNAGTSSRVRADGKRPDIAEWFYVPGWKRAPRSRSTPRIEVPNPSLGGWLVLAAEDDPLSEKILGHLGRLGVDVTAVRAGTAFERHGAGAFVLDPRRPDEYEALLRTLDSENRFPSAILHLWSAPPETDALRGPSPRADFLRERGFDSLLFLGQALGELGANRPVRIGVVTSGVCDVTGDEELVPEKATILGPCRVLPAELPAVRCSVIDISAGDWREGGARLAERAREVVSELVGDSAEQTVALRGSHRWLPTFEPVRLEAARAPDAGLRAGGAYLITGGLGGIGLALARDFASRAQVKLVLTTRRTDFPARDEWDARAQDPAESEPMRRALRELLALESSGSEILVGRADVTDLEGMRGVVDEATRRFGPIRGVVHAAGLPGGGMIQLKTREQAREVMAAKVLGTRVLETLFESRELDFLVLCSSLTSVLGGVGQVDYCAANAFLDAFAHQNDMRRRTRSEGPQCTVAIDWDTWSETGMTVETEVPADLRETRARRLRTGLSNAEGCESFHRILAAEQPQVLVSTRSLDDVRREVESESAGDTEACGVTSAVAARATHARPALATEFVAPRNEGERAVAEIWEDLFGLTGVGVRDSFLELGGHSLLAVQLVNRLNRAFGTRLTLRALFEDPTVAALAERIDAAADRGARPADSIRAPLAVDELSDREVASMLRRMLDEDPYSDEETLRAD